MLLKARWYPTLTNAGTGRFLVTSGTGELGPGDKVRSFELLTVKTRDGSFIPSAHQSLIPYMQWAVGASSYVSKFFPFLWPIKNQEVTTNQLMTRDHQWMLLGQDTRSLRLPLSTLAPRGHWGEHNATNWGDPGLDPVFGYIYPAGAWIDGRALICGGADGTTAPAKPDWTFIDTNPPTPTYTNSNATTRMRVPRQNHGLVILPNNTFMAIGGNIDRDVHYSTAGATALAPASSDWPFLNTATTYAHNRPEFFDPVTKTWTMPTGNEHLLPLPLRPYHTTALLLPNGYVFVGGGEDAPADGLPGSAQHHNYLYKPSYIPANDADRPLISIATNGGAMFYDTPYSAQLISNQGHNFRRIMFISLGSMTHSFDMGQRGYTMTMGSIPPESEGLGFGEQQSMQGLGQILIGSLTASDPWYMPPGWYMAFVEDSVGNVSNAQVVRIIERYSIDLPVGPFEVKTASSWNVVSDIKPLIHGDAVYETAGLNSDWGGIYGNYVNANNAGRMVEISTSSPAIRVKTPLPAQVNLGLNNTLRVKIEARTNLTSCEPTFKVKHGQTGAWISMSYTSMPSGLFRQLGKGERYREYFLTPASPFNLNSNNEVEIEVTFPGASEAHVDMIQVGGYLQAAPY